MSEGSKLVIRKLSDLLVNNVNLRITRSPLDCASIIAPEGQGKTDVNIHGGRPFPYYYSSRHPRLHGFVFYSVTISGTDRVVNFVKLGGDASLPHRLRRTYIYLLPLSQQQNPFITSRFILLDRPISLPIDFIGKGKNIYVTRRSVFTTARVPAEYVKQQPGTDYLVLEVNEGAVKNVNIDETIDPSEIVKVARELSGQHILLHKPLEEAARFDNVCRHVGKRLRQYETLLRKIAGSWPSTITDLQKCLSVTMKELIVAALFVEEVRERIPEPKCFFGPFIDIWYSKSQGKATTSINLLTVPFRSPQTERRSTSRSTMVRLLWTRHLMVGLLGHQWKQT